MRAARGMLFFVGCSVLFLLCAAAPAAALTLDAPNGGVFLTSGSKFVVRWSLPGKAVNFALSYSRDGGASWKTIAIGVKGKQYAWRIPVVERNEPNCLVKVEGFAAGKWVAADKSDRKFAILAGRVTEPNGTETFMPGQAVTVSWKTYVTRRPVASVSLSYTLDGGLTWKPMAAKIAGNPGVHRWIVPAALTGKYPSCKAMVTLLDSGGRQLASDASDAAFSIGMVSLSPGAAVLDAASIALLSGHDPALGELRFGGWTPFLLGLVPARDTLVVTAVPGVVPAGLIGSAVAIRDEGGQAVVTLGDATLASVITEGTASLFHTFTQEDFESVSARVELAEGVTLLSREAQAAADPEMLAEARAAGFGPEGIFTYAIDKTFSGQEGDCSYSVSFKGTLALGVDIDISGDLGWKGLEKFRFETRPFQQASLRVEGSGECATGKSWPIAKLYGEPVVVQVSVVPVVFVPYVEIDVGFDAMASATVALEARQNLSVSTGVSYVKDRSPEWKSFWEPSYDFGLVDVEAYLNGALTGYLRPQAGARIYGLTGPHFGLRGYLQLRGTVDLLAHAVSWGFYGGVAPFVGVDVDLLALDASKRWEFATWENLLWPEAKPATPANLRAAAGGAGPVLVEWDPAANAVMYDVYRARGRNQTSGFSLQASVAEPRYLDLASVVDLDYTYRVKGRNVSGAGPESGTVTGWRKIQAPNPTASKGQYVERVEIVWPLVVGAATYGVYRSPGGTSPGVLLQEIPAATCTSPCKYNDLGLGDTDPRFDRVEARADGDHDSKSLSAPVDGWLSKCVYPEGDWSVSFGSCVNPGSQQPGVWSFSLDTVSMNDLGCSYGCTHAYTFDSDLCTLGWSGSDATGSAAWNGTLNKDTGLTIAGTHTWRPRIIGMEHPLCWTATRQAPKPVDKDYLLVVRDSGGVTVSWRRVPGAQKYNLEILVGATWNPIGYMLQQIKGPIAFRYTGDLPPVLPGLRVQAENIAGKSDWTRYVAPPR